jgi:S1-C subfamily serine protease
LGGLARGDLIVEMNGWPALSTVAFAELLEDLPERQGLQLTVLRGDTPHSIALTPPAG